MQLDSLRDFDAITANRILANAAFVMANGEASASLPEGAIDRLIAEIRDRLKIGSNDFSESSTKKIDVALGKALNALSSSEAVNAAAQRLGAKGELPIGAYQIDFVPSFKADFKPLGKNEKFVKRWIRNSENFQHINILFGDETIADVKDVDRDAVSYFVAASRSKFGPHSVVIQTHRNGSTLVVQGVWHLIPGVVNYQSSDSPKHLVKNFANQFERAVKLGSHTEKFLDSILVESSTVGLVICDGSKKFDSNVIVMPPHCFTLATFRVDKDRNKSPVDSAYAISMAEYRSALIEKFGRSWLSNRP